jgi:Carboxypeptidase regulatory-like domain
MQRSFGYAAQDDNLVWARKILLVAAVLSVLLPSASAAAQEIILKGRVVDPQGNALANALVQLVGHGEILETVRANSDGEFLLKLATVGEVTIRVEAAGFRAVSRSVTVQPGGNSEITIALTQLASRKESITVSANANEIDVLSPDPGEMVFADEDLLEANPGRPGAAVSIPGYPIETASGGIKAPQYFAPGVAGDHGEPIAQYIAVGSYLVPNNLSANAHGNGYADPNIFIPEVLESVEVDGGAFNVREGNHSDNLATTYGLRSRLDPFITVNGDYRDIEVVGGWSPSPDSWIALSGGYGNGLLERLEHRQQYKVNGERLFHRGRHRLTMFGIGYYGISYVPGLVPIFPLNSVEGNFPNYGDTIDPRQKDQTHTALAALNDVWQLSGSQQLQLSGFFRTYNLSLFSDFGQGLIRQSEFRTVAGGSANYVKKIRESLSLLAGFDYDRDAPRRDDLDHYGFFDPQRPDYYGPFTPVDGNNITIGSFAPYVAAEGRLARYFRYYLGWRRDQIEIDNQDLVITSLVPDDSFHKWVGLNSLKASVSFLPKECWYVPVISLSFGQAFFTEDPRIGVGTGTGTVVPGSPVARLHSYQLLASKSIQKVEVKLTLGHVTSSAQLAKIDPDTGLQEDEGPSRLRFLTLALQRKFRYGLLLATFSKADARDLDSGLPTPEAPRTLFDLLGGIQKLPWRLQTRGEFEYVGTKPLGTGCLPDLNAECSGTPVKEFRGEVVRPFMEGRVSAGLNFLVARGFAGQTTENFYPSEIQEVVGVRIPSYAGISFSYRFGGRTP